jgi:two-component system response regulator YesN
MYKVLLADDEELDLEGLRRFIAWHELDMEVIASVNSGFTALEVMEREHVDILVTDIKMPNMSGLELARNGQEKYPQLKIVFVSGYADFQYAKQAISLHASNYVLKPVDNREMVQVLQRIRDELHRERERSKRESVLQETIPYLKNDLMVRWLEGKAEYKMIVALMEQYGLASITYPAAVAIVEVDDLAWKLNSFPEEQRKVIVDRLFGTLLQLFRTHRIEHYCTIDSHRIALIVSDSNSAAMLESWIREVSSGSPMSITIGLGEAACGPDALSRSYLEAKEALNGKLFYGKCRLIRAFDKRPEIVRDTKDVNDILETMFTAMIRHDLVHIDDCIDDLFVLVKKLDGKLSIYHFLLHVIGELNKHLRTLNEDFYKLLDLDLKSLVLIYHFETVQDIQSWLRRKSFEISERLHMKKMKKNRKLIEEIQRYIDDHLGQNITLRHAADFFSFSPNYLGHIFKEETGTNFSDYVISRRLELAKKLLQNPKLKIFEISERVGYKNLTYFNRHFKEVYGMTPGEYRRQS